MFSALPTPAHIQQFLDDLEYDGGAGAASPRLVIRTRKAQCFSGALFACAALRELGHPPRLMYIDAVGDDGHCVAVYESGGFWGGLAKSNYTTARSREPIYSYFALGLSYFDGYYNNAGRRTMRSFTIPVELEQYESHGWRFSERQLLYIDRAIDRAPKAWVLPRQQIRQLSKVSPLLQRAGLLGASTNDR